MKAVLQRVSHASVKAEGNQIGSVKQGFLILLGVAPGDTEKEAEFLAEKIAGLRVFSDAQGKMNRSLLDCGGSALVVSQFTLFADCRHGRRPSFTQAAPPALAKELYEYFVKKLEEQGVSPVQTGSFGADMQVELLNDGPVTILLDTKELL